MLQEETQSSGYSEDHVKLREIELKTSFQVQALSDAVGLLKTQLQGLNNRLYIVIGLVGIQLLEAPDLVKKLLELL